jgi:hypothetical protein
MSMRICDELNLKNNVVCGKASLNIIKQISHSIVHF